MSNENNYIDPRPYVVLVDTDGNNVGQAEKLYAHQQGWLHRCFSICVYNDNGEILLQKRADHKYHSPGLWTNTCCSHQQPGEQTLDAAHLRLAAEMGFDCPLKPIGSFIYRAEFDNGLIEHEYDEVLIGTYNNEINPNPDEASEYKWVDVDKLRQDMENNPAAYTAWLKLVLDHIATQK